VQVLEVMPMYAILTQYMTTAPEVKCKLIAFFQGVNKNAIYWNWYGMDKFRTSYINP